MVAVHDLLTEAAQPAAAVISVTRPESTNCPAPHTYTLLVHTSVAI